jgi:hypothetical protein
VTEASCFLTMLPSATAFALCANLVRKLVCLAPMKDLYDLSIQEGKLCKHHSSGPYEPNTRMILDFVV